MRPSPRSAMVLAAGLGTRMRPLTDTHAEAAGAGRRQGADRSCAGSAGRRRRRARGGQRASHRRPIERHLEGPHAPQIVISDERGELLDTGGGVVKALPRLGDEPFFHVNSDTIWIEGVKPNLGGSPRRSIPARMDVLLLLAPTATSIGYAAAAISPWRRTAGCAARRARGRAVRLCRRRDPRARAVRRMRRTGAFSLTACSTAREARPAVRPAARRRLDACRHARGDQGGAEAAILESAALSFAGLSTAALI